MKLSNNEIKLKMKILEDEYESKKNKIVELVNDLTKLDEEYNNLQLELEKIRKNLFNLYEYNNVSYWKS